MHPAETYLNELRSIRSTGAGVKETSYYTPMANLFNEIGKTLKPKVRCIMTLKNQGAGFPDGGLFTASQFQKASDPNPLEGQMPERGVIEAKSTSDDAWLTAEGEQVTKYWGKYRQVLVTNYRDFVLVGKGSDGKPAKLETFRLAESEAAFWSAAAHPRKMAETHGERLIEYLTRVMLYAAPLAEPQDVAWFLASYARDAKARIEGVDLPALSGIRAALEEALGIKFEGEKGEKIFLSTLVQTLFYGVFSAWVLWSKHLPKAYAKPRFDWRVSAHHLRVPILRKLFHEVSEPGQLEALNLSEVLDWSATALNRVDRDWFFSKFEEKEGHAVQYFYEPFLEAFDPELRKELGVWFTPPEIVQYMVARVDAVLREELNIPDGLADPNVYILDPCCGTSTYLLEVLKRIAVTLKAKGGDALVAEDLKKAAMERVFGFEILPAPFVVAHLQLGLLLESLGAPLSDKKNERVGVYLTNALTGWEPPKGPKQRLMFPELEEERDAAEKVKRDTPILVILGNPPYNGFAGVAVDEERDLSNAYRTTKHAPAPQGQGLNDLYVRFFRVAEHRIVENLPGRGVVCFISNYSWLDGLSFTGMRERYLEVFDNLWIDCLNGDKYKTGKLTPEGEPDPSIFSTEWNREGIQVGTAIALLVRKEPHGKPNPVRFRHLWGKTKREQLLETAEQDGESLYQKLDPPIGLGLPFMPAQVGAGYMTWPLLPELLPITSPGVQTSRDIDVVAIDRKPLEEKIRAYFNSDLSNDALRGIVPSMMTSTGRYDAVASRKHLLKKGMASGFFFPYCYRPFDKRDVYWHPETKLIDEKREDLVSCFQAGNLFLTSRQKAERQNEGTPFYVTRHLPDRHLTRPGSQCFPISRKGWPGGKADLFSPQPSTPDDLIANLSQAARTYLATLGIPNPEEDAETARLVWMHALAIGYSPAYLSENADGIRQDWPRIPLPDTKKALLASAALGRQVAALLDTESLAQGVTTGTIHPELKTIGVISRFGGGSLNPNAGDLTVTAGWGHPGKDGITMPGKGKLIEREYTADEKEAIVQGAKALGLNAEAALAQLGKTTLDVYLNDIAFWKNIPSKVWDYTIGGYQVIKKWLSYRESKLLGRSLSTDEAREVMNIARRIAAILLLEPALDANYQTVKASTYAWPKA